ncbi:metallophosphoesterase [Deinococcus arenicola]|uniref:Metallophosphoesterase n=1 Tax=Deinococcus arenicola TaxID=2994950 RepID=A0ABU4DMH5_9DEIO|nr:metallophosphoesterase [Deinococcus sp. ZS9-10]MDV6373644.1 metallophosphoesterase [Deinococcus sp. ZS9-10]
MRDTERRSRELWVIGDIHGAYGKLRAMLLRSGLIDFDGSWAAGDAHLVFLGDYLDRGPKGVEVVRLIRRLEAQAVAHGGQVTALLGNHEVMFMAALLFRRSDPEDALGFREYWQSNGGQQRDVSMLDPGDLAWLEARPAMVLSGGWLLIHADSAMYLRMGSSVQAVNDHIHALLLGRDADAWGLFINAFADRFAFALGEGEKMARRMLRTFGGDHLAHGHTPVYILLDEHLHGPTLGAGAPIPYAEKLCVAMDSGMAYRDDAGFIARLDEGGIAEVISNPGTGQLY